MIPGLLGLNSRNPQRPPKRKAVVEDIGQTQFSLVSPPDYETALIRSSLMRRHASSSAWYCGRFQESKAYSSGPGMSMREADEDNQSSKTSASAKGGSCSPPVRAKLSEFRSSAGQPADPWRPMAAGMARKATAAADGLVASAAVSSDLGAACQTTSHAQIVVLQLGSRYFAKNGDAAISKLPRNQAPIPSTRFHLACREVANDQGELELFFHAVAALAFPISFTAGRALAQSRSV